MNIQDIVEWTPWSIISVIVGLLVYFLINPVKVEKWSGMIAGLFEMANTRAARHSMASEVQSAATAYIKSTNSKDVLPYGLKIEWVKEDMVESYVDKQHDDVVVIMQYRKNRSRNFVIAIREYTSKAFIPTIRHDIPPQLVTAAELIVQEKIIRAERNDALEIFKTETLPLQIGTNQEVDASHKALKRIEELGFFENIFLNEILVASEALKTFDEHLKTEELYSLIDFLNTFYKREPGEDITLEHNKKMFKLGVILVARSVIILAGGTNRYAKRAKTSVSRGLRTVYVTGTKDDRKYVARVVDHISSEGILSLEWVRQYKKIKNMKMQNYTIAFFRR